MCATPGFIFVNHCWCLSCSSKKQIADFQIELCMLPIGILIACLLPFLTYPLVQVSLQAFAGQDLEFAVKANTGGMFGSGAPRNITYRVHVHVRLSCHELRSSFDRFTKNCASPVPPLHRQGDTDKPNSPGVHARFVVSHSGLFSKMAMLRLNPMVIAEPSIAGFKLYNDKKGVELLALGDPQLQCDGDLVCSIKLSPALNLTAGDHVRAHFERLSVEHIREVRLIGYKYVDSCHLAAELNPTCMQSYSHLQERLAWDSQNNQGQCASDLVQLGDVIHDYYKSCQPVAPRIHIMPTDTAYIVRGQTVQLHCSVLANPAPMVKWIGPAGNSLPFPLRKDLDNPKVVVATIAVGTPGMYVCTASNYLAQVRSSVMVQIQGRLSTATLHIPHSVSGCAGLFLFCFVLGDSFSLRIGNAIPLLKRFQHLK